MWLGAQKCAGEIVERFEQNRGGRDERLVNPPRPFDRPGVKLVLAIDEGDEVARIREDHGSVRFGVP
jgi:hypothetical protein